MSNFDDVIRKDLADTLENWRPSDVSSFNGTSWMNLISIAIGDGSTDADHKMAVTNEDRRVATRLLRKALEAAAERRGGSASTGDPVAFYGILGTKLPPPPAVHEPTVTPWGSRVARVDEDPARLERHEVLAAIVLEACEKDSEWRPTKDEALGALKKVGLLR